MLAMVCSEQVLWEIIFGSDTWEKQIAILSSCVL